MIKTIAHLADVQTFKAIQYLKTKNIECHLKKECRLGIKV